MVTLELPALATQDKAAAVCPACLREDMVDVFDGGELPVNVGIFYSDRASAMRAPRGRILLAHCPACGFVHNRQFDATSDIFRPGYEVALHHSDTFRAFITELAQRLIDRFDLHGKRIVEIGCGDAYFLGKLASLGDNMCTGIDPTVAREGRHLLERGEVRLIRDYFGPAYQALPADFVCCLSVFEDIPQPGPFLAAAHALAARAGAPLYFEVFNAGRAFRAGEVWSVHYEQCNYFNLDSLRSIFTRHGFHVDTAATCYEANQYLFVEARAHRGPPREGAAAADPDGLHVLRSFEREFSSRRKLWSRRLAQFRSEGRRAVLWGTGGKGITFLNSVPGAETIEFVAEINPAKQGKFVPGTGQRIVPPGFLADYQPDTIIITNPLYEAEMKRQAGELGVTAEFLVA